MFVDEAMTNSNIMQPTSYVDFCYLMAATFFN